MVDLNYKEIRRSSSLSPMQRKVHDIIFEADTLWGKVFDITLLILIFLSVTITALDSVESLNLEYGSFFSTCEWVFTVLFTIEYILRLYCVAKPLYYADLQE